MLALPLPHHLDTRWHTASPLFTSSYPTHVTTRVPPPSFLIPRWLLPDTFVAGQAKHVGDSVICTQPNKVVAQLIKAKRKAVVKTRIAAVICSHHVSTPPQQLFYCLFVPILSSS
uniref:Uncharacterized protein n=1 Tax=Palpitomonas bilix TaxID=652834 RepID=A0A7S3GKH1_9EUKA